jgi:DDE_Tnp_1-associated/Transposase DDE domain
VPAPTSSRIPTAAQRPDTPVALAPDQCRSLLEDLATIIDPRKPRGRRHALATVLAVAVAAVLAGASSLVAIGEWAADAPQPVLAALGVRRDPLRRVWRPPGEATVRRVLARVDPDALDQVIGRWLADQQSPSARAWRRAVAVDGKTLRGSGHRPNPQVHLLAAMDHTRRAVLAQTDVDATTNEIARFQPLLDRLDLTDTVLTADAIHTQREHADWLVTAKHAAYLLIVKANQCAARRLAVSPNGVGRDSKRYLWVRWLTWIRKEKGTRACQRTGGQAQASGMTRRVTRVIWRKLDCLNPNLQRMPLASTGKAPETGAGLARGCWLDSCTLRGRSDAQ